ncbi:MAG: hypothetical protein IPM47_18640 [Sphingobacteriales bacterium]|nr:MAG: hypothetical protein IPM47_18640 [Sphingobacteriales bacterium]
MKKASLILSLFFSLFFFNNTQAQDYKSAIGGKLGYGLIASYKTFLSEKGAVDFFGGITWNGGLAVGAFYQHHLPIPKVERLKVYFGGGASFFSYAYGTIYGTGLGRYIELGIAGNAGLDYSFNDFPLNLSLDWAPTIVVLSSFDEIYKNINRFRSGYGALTVRYIISGHKKTEPATK